MSCLSIEVRTTGGRRFQKEAWASFFFLFGGCANYGFAAHPRNFKCRWGQLSFLPLNIRYGSFSSFLVGYGTHIRKAKAAGLFWPCATDWQCWVSCLKGWANEAKGCDVRAMFCLCSALLALSCKNASTCAGRLLKHWVELSCVVCSCMCQYRVVHAQRREASWPCPLALAALPGDTKLIN